MEKLGSLPPTQDGKLFGESWMDVSSTEDIVTLWRQALSFLGNDDVSVRDLTRSITNPDGILEDGTVFQRTTNTNAENRTAFFKGATSVEIIYNGNSKTACVLKRINSES